MLLGVLLLVGVIGRVLEQGEKALDRGNTTRHHTIITGSSY
jgi:hypothetical protein